MMFRDRLAPRRRYNLYAHVDQMFKAEGRQAGSAAAAVHVPRRGHAAGGGLRSRPCSVGFDGRLRRRPGHGTPTSGTWTRTIGSAGRVADQARRRADRAEERRRACWCTTSAATASATIGCRSAARRRAAAHWCSPAASEIKGTWERPDKEDAGEARSTPTGNEIELDARPDVGRAARRRTSRTRVDASTSRRRRRHGRRRLPSSSGTGPERSERRR